MMKSKKIFNRLIFSFVIVLAILVVTGILGIYGTMTINSTLSNVFEYNIIPIQAVGDFNAAFLSASVEANKCMIAALGGDVAGVEAAKKNSDRYFDEFEGTYSTYEGSINTDEDRNLFAKMKPFYEEYKRFAEEMYSVSKNSIETGDVAPVMVLSSAGAAKRDAVVDALVALRELNVGYANDEDANSSRLTTVLMIAQISLMVVGTVFSIALIMMLALSIEKDLKSVVGKLVSSTGVIDTATSQLTEASENLATGSSRQAAAIEQTSATMNETSSMIAQNAENTRQAAQLAQKTNKEANDGMKKMSEMVQAMEQIKESSDTISRIVKVIDDIAFQTNLLAINATVEAARAGGEAGRSFSVVAEEVRNLAQKSSKAAADTTEIIEKNIALTGNGREISRNVAEALEHITDEADQLSKILGEINAASEEQANGVKQINIAIGQMERVTQENAAVAEENAASSNSMRDEIGNLREAVSVAEQLLREAEDTDSYSNHSSGRPTSGGRNSHTSSVYDNPHSVSMPKKSIQSSGGGSSQKSISNAEKIIPLDDDDNF